MTSKFGEYITNQNGIFDTLCKKIIKKIPNRGTAKKNENEKIIKWEILFKDDSTLEALEHLSIKDNKIEKKRYGYHYHKPTGFFFFYDFEGEGGDQQRSTKDEKLRSKRYYITKKPRYHLHVGVGRNFRDKIDPFPELLDHDGPHYKTPLMDIEEIVGIIIVNFFDDDKYLSSDDIDQIIEKLEQRHQLISSSV